MSHRDSQDKIKQDLKTRPDMGNKCPVFEAWQHKKYLRKNWNSSVNFNKSEYLLEHGTSAQEGKRKEHTIKKERAETARAERLARSSYWDGTQPGTPPLPLLALLSLLELWLKSKAG